MMDVELPDGTLLKDVPEGTTKSQIAEKLKSSGHEVPAGWMKGESTGKSKDDVHSSEEYEDPKTLTQKVKNIADLMGKSAEKKESPLLQLGDAALGVGSGIIGPAVGGLAGLGRTALGVVGGEGLDASMKKGAETSGSVQNAMTYQPRTAGGNALVRAASLPLEVAGAGAGALGGVIGQAVGGNAGEAAGRSIGEAAVPIIATLVGGIGALKARPGIAAAADAATASAAKEVVSRAEVATRNAGIDWGKLSVQARKNIVEFAKDATSFEKMSPDAIKRAALLESLPSPVKGTKGQLERDPVQLRNEQQLSNTKEGTPIRERYIEQNKGLLDSLDILAGKGSPKAKTAEDVGRQVSEKALEEKAKDTKAKVRSLYSKANASAESSEKVSPYPLIDYVREHPNASAVSWITDRLKKQQVITGTDDLAQPMPSRDVSLRELSELRKVAERVSKGGGEGAGWAPEVKDLLDKMMNGKGGKDYAAARDAHKEYKSEFSDQQAVKQLVETKGKYSTDRKVALEDVFQKTVVGGSIQDLRNVRQSLLDAENSGTRKQGRKALRELAGATVNYIKEQATKAGGPDETGARNVSPAALRKAVNDIGDEKLDLLLGKTTSDQLRSVVQASDDLKTSPPKRIQGSDTNINLLGMLDKLVGKVPIGGDVVRGAAKIAARAHEVGKSDRAVREALMDQKRKVKSAPYKMKEAGDRLGDFLPGAGVAYISEDNNK